jgi:1,4-dihydroxy-2-naphthoate polyprenyltransferase
MSSLTRPQVWLLAARPKTLPAAVGPVLVGTALAIADDAFAPGPALAALVGALLLQIGSNFANDYFDFFRGADTADRLGPPRATASGLISPAEMRWGMAAIFGAAALVGLYLIWVGGWPVLAIGAASILADWLIRAALSPLAITGWAIFLSFSFLGWWRSAAPIMSRPAR